MAPSPELVINAVSELMANSSAGKSAFADWLGSIVGTKISPLAQSNGKDFANSIHIMGEIGGSELPPLGNLGGEPKVVAGNVREFFVKQMGTLLIPQVRTLEVESGNTFAKIFSQNNSILRLTHTEGVGSAFLVDLSAWSS